MWTCMLRKISLKYWPLNFYFLFYPELEEGWKQPYLYPEAGANQDCRGWKLPSLDSCGYGLLGETRYMLCESGAANWAPHPEKGEDCLWAQRPLSENVGAPESTTSVSTERQRSNNSLLLLCPSDHHLHHDKCFWHVLGGLHVESVFTLW